MCRVTWRTSLDCAWTFVASSREHLRVNGKGLKFMDQQWLRQPKKCGSARSCVETFRLTTALVFQDCNPLAVPHREGGRHTQ